MGILFIPQGSPSYAYVPYNTSLNFITNAVSVTLWAKLTGAASLQMFINRMVSATPGYEWWSLNLQDMRLRALIGNSSQVTNILSPSVISLNTWYHFAFTYSSISGGISLYQNGLLVAAGIRSLTFGADTTGVVIGANAQGANDTNITESMSGYLEDIRVYSSELRLSEIQTIMNSEGKDCIVNNLILQLKMDELAEFSNGPGSYLKDSGPYGLDALLSGNYQYTGSTRYTKRLPNVL